MASAREVFDEATSSRVSMFAFIRGAVRQTCTTNVPTSRAATMPRTPSHSGWLTRISSQPSAKLAATDVAMPQ